MPDLVAAAPFAFAGLVLLCCGTAALFGGREGRWVACLYMSACLATNLASRVSWDWTRPNHLILAIDAALLIALYVVAMTSRRYWPLWITGLHLLTVSAHLGAIVAPAFDFKVYFILEVMWSLPKMGVLLIGVLGDWRRDHESQTRRRARGVRSGRADGVRKASGRADGMSGPAPVASRRIRVLVVDNQPDDRILARIALGLDPDMEVHEVATGEAALKCLSQGLEPDIVLLNPELPGLSGEEVAHAITRPGANAGPLIVFLTSRNRSREDGGVCGLRSAGTITKPFNPLSLSVELREILFDGAIRR